MADVEEIEEVPAEQEQAPEPNPEVVEVAPEPEEAPKEPTTDPALQAVAAPEPEPVEVPAQELNIAALVPLVGRTVFYVPEAGVLARVLLLELFGDGTARLLWHVTTEHKHEFTGVPYDAAGAVATWREVA